jgi:hypothetical protein
VQKMLPAMVILCACSFHVSAQDGSQMRSVPLHSLVYPDGEQFWSKLPSPAVFGPLGCTEDGSVIINSVLPEARANTWGRINFYYSTDPVFIGDEDKKPMQLSVIEPTGRVQNYDFSVVNDLEHVINARSYDVAENSVDFLIHAIPKTSSGTDPTAPDGDFIARFNREGQYQGATEVVIPGLKPLKSATFPNGDLLVLGIDEDAMEARLVRYSLFGQNTFIYKQDVPFEKRNGKLPPPLPANLRASPRTLASAYLEAALRFTQMVHYKDSIFVLQMDVGMPLFQVFADGSIRTIHLPTLSGYEAESVIPSDVPLYVRYRAASTNTTQSAGGLILEMNPNSSETIQWIPPGSFPIWQVACVNNGVIRAVRMGSGYNFRFVTAQLH